VPESGDIKPKFDGDDVELLVTTLDLAPDLKVCALALKHHRDRNSSKYPLGSTDDLLSLFDGEQIEVLGHQIDRKHIERYVDPELFPIENDRALAAAVYLALSQCNTEMAWALQGPPHAYELLALAEKQRAVIQEELKAEGGEHA
jgi:hypothetical protein